MPPTTTPTSTMIVSCRAKSGVTNGVCTVRITATAAASAPDSTTASADHLIGLDPEHAGRAEVGGGGARAQPDLGAAEQQRERAERAQRDEDGDDRDLAHVDARRWRSTG